MEKNNARGAKEFGDYENFRRYRYTDNGKKDCGKEIKYMT